MGGRSVGQLLSEQRDIDTHTHLLDNAIFICLFVSVSLASSSFVLFILLGVVLFLAGFFLNYLMVNTLCK